MPLVWPSAVISLVSTHLIVDIMPRVIISRGGSLLVRHSTELMDAASANNSYVTRLIGEKLRVGHEEQ